MIEISSSTRTSSSHKLSAISLQFIISQDNIIQYNIILDCIKEHFIKQKQEKVFLPMMKENSDSSDETRCGTT